MNLQSHVKYSFVMNIVYNKYYMTEGTSLLFSLYGFLGLYINRKKHGKHSLTGHGSKCFLWITQFMFRNCKGTQ